MDFENEFEKVLASQDVQESDVAPTVQEPTWTRIKDFKIYSVEGGTTLYANGRQQVQIRVSIRVSDDFAKSMELEGRAQWSLHLVKADGLEPLPYGLFDSNTPQGWRYTTHRDELFKPLPYQGIVKGGLEGDKVYSRDFYVTTTASSSISLMAAVVRSDGTIFYTDMKTADGILTLNTLPPAVYGNNHFRLKMMDRLYYQNEKASRSDIFKLELVVDNHQIEFVKFVDVSPGTFVVWYVLEKNHLGFLSSAYINGKLNYFEQSYNLEAPQREATRRTYPGAVTIFMSTVEVDSKLTIRESQLKWRVWKLALLDMYGNEHVVTLTYSREWPIALRLY